MTIRECKQDAIKCLQEDEHLNGYHMQLRKLYFNIIPEKILIYKDKSIEIIYPKKTQNDIDYWQERIEERMAVLFDNLTRRVP